MYYPEPFVSTACLPPASHNGLPSASYNARAETPACDGLLKNRHGHCERGEAERGNLIPA